ncbi:MAG: hypothetical protein ACTSRP_11460 [Candidatus Helarchaeota archaeon]
MDLFKEVVELLTKMSINNEKTITVRKIRKKLKLPGNQKISREIKIILQWLFRNNYLTKINKKTYNKYQIIDNFSERKNNLEIFYKD